MILLDWTRMGKSYCLAGAVVEHGTYRIVRPLLLRGRDAPDRKVGWSAYLLDGHCRWEVFELIGVRSTPPEPPHLEDLWVRAMKPRRRLATPAERRAILDATAGHPEEPLFGAPLVNTHAAAHLARGTGNRSLVTVAVPAGKIVFSASRREGSAETDIRVTMPVPGAGERQLPVKDHHLLGRAEQASSQVDGQLRVLRQAVDQMGETVAVRLGLSRAYQGNPGRAPAVCWLMADGFFSWSDPQP
jgi:hypothetical protein